MKKLCVWAIRSKVTNKTYAEIGMGPLFHSRKAAREVLASISFKEHWKVVKLEEVTK